MAQEFKLKLDSLDMRNGEKREVEVEGIENGKVLLAKVHDEVHAMSANCTHYGAPLIKGVITGSGRLTCAWHGACFNVATGDVEDSPAIDPLAKFPVSEKNGGVYITGDAETIKANRGKADLKCSVQGQEKVVIVGGGSGTIGALEGLRKSGYKGAITLISREPYLPIDRTKLSKALIADPSKLALHDAEWFKSTSVETVTDDVTSVDFTAKKVSTESGKSFAYTKLILATGGTPKKLPLPGFKDLNNVFLLRTIPDVKAILGAVGESKGKKIVVIGSSFIGMEVANALSSENDVTVVGMEKAPLERVMGQQVGSIFRRILENNGVKFHMEASVDHASPSDSSPSTVGAVHLKDGTTLPADLVVLGIGVSPATEFLQSSSSSLPLEKDGSLRTTEHFTIPSLPDVYAIGDIATYPYHGPGGDGALTRIEHWNVAQNAGRAVGHHIARTSSSSSGKSPQPPPAKRFIPIFWSALGSQLRYCGNTPNGWDDVVLQGNPDDNSFAAFYTLGDTVVAVATMMMDPVMSHSAELMRRGKMLGKRELRDGADVLGVSVPAELKI
ncbi:MAG: hypothetical protein M1833_005597 [Piccolia ochrophora]|nr:MAG: hypothetical protein M1833_005597 [Piccolia ochrophora]